MCLNSDCIVEAVREALVVGGHHLALMEVRRIPNQYSKYILVDHHRLLAAIAHVPDLQTNGDEIEPPSCS